MIAFSMPVLAAKGGIPGPPTGGESANRLSVPGVETTATTSVAAFWSPPAEGVLGTHYSYGCDAPESDGQFSYPNTSCVDSLTTPTVYYTAEECTDDVPPSPCKGMPVERIYWQKVDVNEWSADSTGISPNIATVDYVDWGDALEAVSWKESSVIRVETQPWTSTIEGFDPTVIEPVFGDVPFDYWAYTPIAILAANGITAGCGDNNYCAEDVVNRAQMAVFLERGMHGSDYLPPPASGNVFLDVAAGDFAANFIEQLHSDGITSGCGNDNFCPDAEVSRAQMAVFLLRAIHGAAYLPPPAIGLFNDVGPGDFASNFIEQLAADGITSGCGDGNFCPNDPVTRAQMAVFLVKAFNLEPTGEEPSPSNCADAAAAAGLDPEVACKIGMQMWHVSGQGITEHWGARAGDVGPFDSFNYDTPFQIIKSTKGRLNLTKMAPESAVCSAPGGNPGDDPPVVTSWNGSGWDGTCQIYDEVYSVETSVGGKFVFGYNWRMREVELESFCGPAWEKTGFWRLTFYAPEGEILFDDATIPNVAPPAVPVALRSLPRQTFISLEPEAEAALPVAMSAEAESEDPDADDRLYRPVVDVEHNLSYIDICIVAKSTSGELTDSTTDGHGGGSGGGAGGGGGTGSGGGGNH
jgi:hypothetical protein